MKNFVPHVEDFPDFTSVTSETSEDQVIPGASNAAAQPISDVTLQEEARGAKLRALQKQWPVDLPGSREARIQTLLECLPEETRGWNVCVEAVQRYVAADEPPYTIDLWGRGQQTNWRKPLWMLLGQALATRDTPAHTAIDILNQMRSQL